LTGHAAGVLSAKFSPDGKLIATISRDGTVRVWLWNSDTEQTMPAVLGGYQEGVYGVAFNPDGKSLVTAGGDSLARIYPWESFAPVPDLIELARLRVKRQFTPEEKKLYLH
jgi:WD40 repeat protein